MIDYKNERRLNRDKKKKIDNSFEEKSAFCSSRKSFVDFEKVKYGCTDGSFICNELKSFLYLFLNNKNEINVEQNINEYENRFFLFLINRKKSIKLSVVDIPV